jgi:hypothetical protein
MIKIKTLYILIINLIIFWLKVSDIVKSIFTYGNNIRYKCEYLMCIF